MKKQNFKFSLLLVLLALFTFNFTYKDNYSSKKTNSVNVKKTQLYSRITVTYSSGITASERDNARACIAGIFGSPVIEIDPCPSNPYAELLRFQDTGFDSIPTAGLEAGSDDDDDELDSTSGINLNAYTNIITESDIALALNCTNIVSFSPPTSCSTISDKRNAPRE